jgi:hypothetical protein
MDGRPVLLPAQPALRNACKCKLLAGGGRVKPPGGRVPADTDSAGSMRYVLPEALRAVEPDAPAASLGSGTVDAQMYQGNPWLGEHADLAEACVFTERAGAARSPDIAWGQARGFTYPYARFVRPSPCSS